MSKVSEDTAISDTCHVFTQAKKSGAGKNSDLTQLAGLPQVVSMLKPGKTTGVGWRKGWSTVVS